MDAQRAYRPIACSLHDHIEASATSGRTCRLRYESAGDVIEVEDRIVDVFSRGGEEFLETAAGSTVRLDRIVSLDDVAFRRTPRSPLS